MTRSLILLAALLGLPSLFPGAQAAAEHDTLFALIDARLGLMADVALYKAERGLAVEDLARESTVLEATRHSAREAGLEPEAVASLFDAQIRVAKAIQYRYLADWQSSPRPAAGRDLATELRPQLLRLGERIVQQLTDLRSGGFTLPPALRENFHQAISTHHVSAADKELLYDSLLLVLANAQSAGPVSNCHRSASLEGPCAIETAALPMNGLQAVGSHNSYKLAMPAPELARIHAFRAETALTLDYGHLPLTEQLDLGMRQIELDILYDPQGGRYADPLLPRETAGEEGARPFDNSDMQAPGFKVLHVQDIDVHSSCVTWIACLSDIRDWSLSHPQHVPILIMFNAKDSGSSYPGVKPALPFDAAAYDAVDAEVLSVFERSHLITPDDIRGDAPSLRQAVLERGWPALDEVRGKVFFALDERPEKVETYLRGRPSLQGLPLFVNSVSEDAEHAAYFTINNPLASQERIRAAVQAGFIVRTRADANTREARSNSLERREAAFASGAQYISTDYYQPRLEWSDYSVSLGDEAPARCNPVTGVDACQADH